MIIDIGNGVDESVVKWKYNDKDKWRDADIDELIHLYESVVHCKDCRHLYNKDFCSFFGSPTDTMDYCSHGEKEREVIKCGECVRHDNCWIFDEHKDDNGTCVWAESKSITESSNDVVESQNDVIKKPRTVRYKLHKPIEYVSIEYDEEETATDIAHYIELVHCKDCKHLEVINTKNTYAICHEHDIIFEPFEDSTKTNFCSWGERREK